MKPLVAIFAGALVAGGGWLALHPTAPAAPPGRAAQAGLRLLMDSAGGSAAYGRPGAADLDQRSGIRDAVLCRPLAWCPGPAQPDAAGRHAPVHEYY
jgi:hypothetical protein